MRGTQSDPRKLAATEGASAAWRNALSPLDGLDRQYRAVDLGDVIRQLIDDILDDRAFGRVAERVAGLVPPTGLVIQKQGKEALRRHDEPHAQTVEHNEVHGLNLLAELFTEVLGVQRLPAAQKLNLAQAVLDDQSDAVLVVDPSGALQFANASAIRLIEISEVLALCGDRLSSPEPLIASSLRTLIRSASKAGRGGELSFPAEMPTYRGSVESLPGADVPLVCIRLRDEKARAAAQADRARLDHGLTLAETQLAEALLSGLTPVDIAERRNVSMSTVRTQLRSLYIKTGVTGQAELKKALDRP